MSDLRAETARDLFEYGIEHQLFIHFASNTAELHASGVPEYVLKKHDEYFPIQLDPMYHEHNNFEFVPGGIAMDLGFPDGVYRCTFLWKAIYNIGFVLPPEGVGEEVEETGPKLCLV